MSDDFIDLMELKSLMEATADSIAAAAGVHWRRLTEGESLSDEQIFVSLTVAGVDLRRRGLLGSLPVYGQPAARQTAAGLLLKAADREFDTVRLWIARADADDKLRHWRDELRRIAQDLGIIEPAATAPLPEGEGEKVPPPPPPDRVPAELAIELSGLHQSLITILWDGEVKSYDQLAKAWGADAASDESIRKEIDRLSEALVKQKVRKGLSIKKGKRRSKQVRLIKQEEAGHE